MLHIKNHTFTVQLFLSAPSSSTPPPPPHLSQHILKHTPLIIHKIVFHLWETLISQVCPKPEVQDCVQCHQRFLWCCRYILEKNTVPTPRVNPITTARKRFDFFLGLIGAPGTSARSIILILLVFNSPVMVVSFILFSSISYMALSLSASLFNVP